MEVDYHYSLFSLDMCFCLYLAVHKGKQKTSVGEKHNNNKTRSNCKSHKIWKGMTQGPCMTKQALNWARARLPDPPTRSANPPQCHLTSRFVHDQVCLSYVTFSPTLHSVLNRIENPLIKQLKNTKGRLCSHDLRIDSHNTFPKSLATVGNLY
jgi:hypothetical protein